MAEARTPRELVAREKQTRSMEYRPPSNLPDPMPKDGYVFRWVATHILGEANPANVSYKLREGWEPCKAEDHPEMSFAATKGGNIELGGLMLCKMPEELAKSRAAYYSTQSAAQMQSVDAKIDEYKRSQSDPRMPLFAERK